MSWGVTLLPVSHKEPIQWPNRAGCSFNGCHALGEHQGSKGHGLSALATRRHHLFIPPLIETWCTTSRLCFGQIKVTILISYLSLHTSRSYAHKSSCLPLPCVSPILHYIILHRAIFVQEVHCIFLCFGVAELSWLILGSLFKASSFPGVT